MKNKRLALLPDVLAYGVCLRWQGKRYYLLWQEDRVLCNAAGKFCFASCDSAMVQQGQGAGLLVSEQACVEFDFDRVLQGLFRPWQQGLWRAQDYADLLNVWNMLEDLARTHAHRLAPYARAKRYRLQLAYEKVFALADVLVFSFPEKPSPCRLSSRERVLVRQYLYQGCKVLLNELENMVA